MICKQYSIRILCSMAGFAFSSYAEWQSRFGSILSEKLKLSISD